MKPSATVPQLTKGRPGVPKEVARKYKSTEKAPNPNRFNPSTSARRPRTSQSLQRSPGATPSKTSRSTSSLSLTKNTNGNTASTKILTPIELAAQGLEWVPPSRYESGHWRKKKKKPRQLPEAAMESLTRGRKVCAKPPLQSSATGKWLRPGGGRFSNAKPKGEIDWIIHRAKQTPAPNQYAGVAYVWGKGGIKISDANPKGEVDWVIYRAKQTPGPNQYDQTPPPSAGMSGGRFSTAFPKTEIEWVEYRASRTPGPSEYKTDLCLYQPKSSRKWVGQLLMDKRMQFNNTCTKRRSQTAKFALKWKQGDRVWVCVRT